MRIAFLLLVIVKNVKVFLSALRVIVLRELIAILSADSYRLED